MRKTRILTMLLVFAMALVLCAVAGAEEVTEGGTWGTLTWELTNAGTLIISGPGWMDNFADAGSTEAWKEHSSKIREIFIDDGVLNISVYAFEGCDNLESVHIPDSVTVIDNSAFQSCSSLSEISIPASVEVIGNNALHAPGLKSIKVFSNNPYFTASSGVLFDKAQRTLIRYPASKQDKSYTIPDSVTRIESNAFANCSLLTTISIPDSVYSIGQGAFTNCSALTSITIPGSVEEMDPAYAFINCSKLTSINVNSANTILSSADGVLFNKNKKVLYTYPCGKTDASYTVPAGVTQIEEGAFLSSKLQSITIPDSITKIDVIAFIFCDELEDVYYTGTKDAWEKIEIKGGNDQLLYATIHFNEAPAAPELSSVKFAKAKATVNQKVTISAVTGTDAVKLIMYAGGKAAKTWTSGYTDADGKRTWKVTYAFAGAGERSLDFKAADANGAESEAKTATITITKAPTLSSVKFAKASAAVKADVTITAVTNTLATKLVMYSGSKAVKTWTSGYTDKDGKRAWKVTYAFAGAGERTLDFKAGDANGALTAAKTATITVKKAQALALSSVKFAKAAATVNQKVTIQAVTSTNAAKLIMYAGGKAAKTWTSGYTDKDGKRTWKVTYAFAGAGERTLDFKAADANGKLSAAKSASITVTKAPKLSSVQFAKTEAKVNEEVTIKAVTSTNVTKLVMYSGTKAVKTWTSGYTDKDGKRVWKVKYTFSGAGANRKLTFKGQDANGTLSAGKDATITITK